MTDYLDKAGLTPYLDALGFNLVGYGCTTCIGNSGPLPEDVSAIVAERNLVVCSVLSGNRNFEGRIQSQVRANYLASPPLVVAYALAGRMTIDLTTEPIGKDRDGKDVYLREIWPTEREIQTAMLSAVKSEMFQRQYANVFDGDERWRSLPVPTGNLFEWDQQSTYVRKPPFVEGISQRAGAAPRYHERARARAARRQRHDRSHFAGRIDSRRQPGGKVSDRAGRQAVRLQLVRRAARQSRSDGARHVRQHPPAQSARARDRRRMDDVISPTAS